MRLPVYLIHWNAPGWWQASVTSLQTSVGVELDITVVNNGPEPLDHNVAGVRVVEARGNRGYTGGANIALADVRAHQPTSRYVLIGSHDLHVGRGTVATLLAIADGHPEFGVLGPRIELPAPSWGGFWNGTSPVNAGPADDVELAERDWVSGTCMLIRVQCADDVGQFDESFGSYCEDVDYCLRARDAGWSVGVATRAAAHGLGSISDRALPMQLANGVRLARKRRGVLGGVRATARIVRLAGGTGVLSIAPLRSSLQRRASRNACSAYVYALADLARRPRRTRGQQRAERPAIGAGDL